MALGMIFSRRGRAGPLCPVDHARLRQVIFKKTMTVFFGRRGFHPESGSQMALWFWVNAEETLPPVSLDPPNVLLPCIDAPGEDRRDSVLDRRQCGARQQWNCIATWVEQRTSFPVPWSLQTSCVARLSGGWNGKLSDAVRCHHMSLTYMFLSLQPYRSVGVVVALTFSIFRNGIRLLLRKSTFTHIHFYAHAEGVNEASRPHC